MVREIFSPLVVEFEDGEEGFLWHFDAADLLHAFLALFLFLEEFAFAGDVATVAFGGDILAHGFYGLTCYDFGAYGGLHGHIELLAGDELFELDAHLAAYGLGVVDIGESREGVDALAIEEYVGLDEAAGAIAYGMIVERRVATADAFELIVEVEDDLGEWHVEVEFHTVGGDVVLPGLHATFLEA